MAFSLKGKKFLTGSADNTARLWDLKGNVIREFKGYGGPVISVAFSPKVKTILTGHFGNGFSPEFIKNDTARLWDLKGNVIQEFKGHSAAFSPDGNSIIIGSHDGTVCLYKVMKIEDFLKKGNFEKLTEEQKKEYGIKD